MAIEFPGTPYLSFGKMESGTVSPSLNAVTELVG
jgi:hypothetical protein